MGGKMTRVIPVPMGTVTAYIIKGEKTILVDTGYKGSENKILNKMYQESINPEDVSMILLTHGHNDHFGSAKSLKDKFGAPVAIHKLDADNIRKGDNGVLKPISIFGKLITPFMKVMIKSKNKGFEPDIILQDDFSLEPYGIDGKVISTPGHTNGSVSVALNNGEIIIGDLMMSFFIKQRPGFPVWANDIDEVKRSINRVVKLSPKVIYASHGGPFMLESVVKKFSSHIE